MAMLRVLARTGATLAPSAPVALHRLAVAVTVTAARSNAVAATWTHGRYLTSSSIANDRAPSSPVGSGQGGRADKDKAKADKERDAKEKLKVKEQRAKEKERKEKEKEKKQQQRIREKEKREKEKEKRARERERARAAREKTKATETKSKTRSVLRPPKVPQNTWQIFLEEYITEKKQQLGPGEKLPSVTVLTKDAVPKYRSLEGAEKQALQDRYQAARDAYPAILDAWQKTLTPDMIRKENVVRANRRRLGLSRKRALRIDGEPKKPLTPFFRFCNEIRAEGANSSVLQGETDITKQSQLLARAWKELSPEQIKPYQDAYAGAQEQYKRDMAEWSAEQERTAQLSA